MLKTVNLGKLKSDRKHLKGLESKRSRRKSNTSVTNKKSSAPLKVGIIVLDKRPKRMGESEPMQEEHSTSG